MIYSMFAHSMLIEGMPREFMSKVGQKFKTHRQSLSSGGYISKRSPSEVYHDTIARNVPSILKNGIIPAPSKSYDNRVYMSRSQHGLNTHNQLTSNDRKHPNKARARITIKFHGPYRHDPEILNDAIYTNKHINNKHITNIAVHPRNTDDQSRFKFASKHPSKRYKEISDYGFDNNSQMLKQYAGEYDIPLHKLRRS